MNKSNISILIWSLSIIFSIRRIISCENYWQSNRDGASSSRRPFDVCYRSYRYVEPGLDYSYRYICNDTVINENYTVNGFTVFKQFYNGVGCQGEPNATLLEDTLPFAIKCGGDDCDLIRYRVYTVDTTDNRTGQCDDDDYATSIKSINQYQERVHVIERCDDDGFVSDSYFCSNDYFYINSYNNDKCNNDGIYAAQYYFEGCNDNDEYIEIVSCGKDSGLAALSADSGIQTWGIIFIVLAIVALICGIAFVVYHFKKSRSRFDIAS